MQAQRDSLIFFSVFQNDVDFNINVENSLNYYEQLKEQIDVVRYLGKYKGVKEMSFCINAKDWDKVKDIVGVTKQESILHVSGDRDATLIYMDKRPDAMIGKFKAIDWTQLENRVEDYSYNPFNQQYFAVV